MNEHNAIAARLLLFAHAGEVTTELLQTQIADARALADEILRQAPAPITAAQRDRARALSVKPRGLEVVELLTRTG